MDQGSNKNHYPAYNFTPTVTKFCVMWEGLSLPHDTKFGNCRCKIVDSRSFHSWSLIHGLRWSGLIKVTWRDRGLALQWRNNESNGCSTICSSADQTKHQRCTSLAFVRGIHRWPMDSPHKGPVTRKMFPFDTQIIWFICISRNWTRKFYNMYTLPRYAQG